MNPFLLTVLFAFLISRPNAFAEDLPRAESITAQGGGVQMYEAGSLSPEKVAADAQESFLPLTHDEFTSLPKEEQMALLKAFWKALVQFEKNQNQVGFQFTKNLHSPRQEFFDLWMESANAVVVPVSKPSQCIYGGRFGIVVEKNQKLNCQASSAFYCGSGRNQFGCEFLSERSCVSRSPESNLTERCHNEISKMIEADRGGHVSDWIANHEEQYVSTMKEYTDFCEDVMSYATRFAKGRPLSAEAIEKMPRTPDESESQYLKRHQATECRALIRTMNKARELVNRSGSKKPLSKENPKALSSRTLKQGFNECQSSGCCNQTQPMTVLPTTRLRLSTQSPSEFLLGKPSILKERLKAAYKSYRGDTSSADSLFDQYTKNYVTPIVEVTQSNGGGLYYMMISEEGGRRVWCRVKSGGAYAACDSGATGQMQLNTNEFVSFSKVGATATLNFQTTDKSWSDSRDVSDYFAKKKSATITISPETSNGDVSASVAARETVGDFSESVPGMKLEARCSGRRSRTGGAE